MGENFYSVQKRSSVWEKISTVNRRDPQCGGKFLQCKEESSVWGNSLSCIYNKRSSVLRNIVKF